VITTALLRSDFAEFADTAKYPDALVGFWISFGKLLLNQDRWGAPVSLSGMAAAVQAGGAGYVVGDALTISGGKFSQATKLVVDAVNAGAIAAAHATIFGDYVVLPANPAAATGGSGNGMATFNLTPAYGDSTLFDFGLELMVAHNLALERRALDEGAKGGVPGWGRGLVNNSSVDKATVGYDTTAAIEEGAGHWNLTTYGTRFKRLMNLVGAGPFQIIDPNDLNPLGSIFAFSGPPFSQFPNPSG